MPRLNQAGDFWCAGIAGAGFSYGDFLDDRAIATGFVPRAGGRAFLNDDEAVTGYHDDSEVRAYNVRTGAHRILATNSVNEIDAGGNVWALFKVIDGQGDVRVSTGLHLPGAYLGAATGPMRNDCIGPDGSVAVRDQYHSLGPWHVHPVGGDPWLLSPGDATNVQLLGGRRALWRIGWTWFASEVEVPKPLTRIAWGLKMLDTPDGVFIVYQCEDGRVLAHINGESVGYVLGSAVDAFGIDAIRMADGRFRVVWATTEGEAPTSIVTAHFRASDPRVPLFGGVVEPPPPPPPPPEKPMLNYRSYERHVADRWHQLNGPGVTEAKRIQLGFSHEELDAILAREDDQSHGIAEEFKAVQCPIFVQIVAELHHVHGFKDVGLSTKNTGNRWEMPDGRSCATDIITVLPTDANGNVVAGNFHIIDALSSIGSNRTSPSWTDHGENKDPNRPWMLPPAPDGVVLPPPGPTPKPTGKIPRDQKHAYWREDTERQECSRDCTDNRQCDRHPNDPIHDVPPDPGPVPTPVPTPGAKDPRIAPIANVLRAALVQLEAVPAVVCPPAPPCELPHNPVCELPHGGAGAPMEHKELEAIVMGWARAFAGGTRRIMTPDLTLYLLYRYLFEGVTDEQNLADARERGR